MHTENVLASFQKPASKVFYNMSENISHKAGNVRQKRNDFESDVLLMHKEPFYRRVSLLTMEHCILVVTRFMFTKISTEDEHTAVVNVTFVHVQCRC